MDMHRFNTQVNFNVLSLCSDLTTEAFIACLHLSAFLPFLHVLSAFLPAPDIFSFSVCPELSVFLNLLTCLLFCLARSVWMSACFDLSALLTFLTHRLSACPTLSAFLPRTVGFSVVHNLSAFRLSWHTCFSVCPDLSAFLPVLTCLLFSLS